MKMKSPSTMILTLMLIGTLFLTACGLTDGLLDQGKQVVESVLDQDGPAAANEPLPSEPADLPQAPQAADEQAEVAQPEQPATLQAERDSNCYHPYFPVVEGAYWTYQESAGEGYNLRVTETAPDAFTLVQEMLTDDVVFTVEWFCSDSGLLSGSFSQVDFLDQSPDAEGMPEMVFETLNWEGQTLPSPEKMELGYTWTSSYQLSAEFDIENLTQSFESNVTVEHEIAAIEEVTVPAGTFPNAVRVDSKGIVEMILNVSGAAMPLSGVDFAYSTWYVEGVGMVSTSGDLTGLSNTVELVEYTLMP